MNSFAFVFPGQGSQSVGMANDYAQVNAGVRDLFQEASDYLHYDLWEVVAEDAEQRLNKTEYTQPALLVASVAAWQTWCTLSAERPAVLAGHSLGEYTALVCSEAISFKDAVQLVSSRGKFMQAAVPEGAGAMAAIVGLSDDSVLEVCNQASDAGLVEPANYNSIGQVVIAGDAEAVAKAQVIAKDKGAKLAVSIPVSVPSHCALMRPAADKLAAMLESIELVEPKIDVVNNVDASVESSPVSIKAALVRQLSSPVRWVDSIQAIQRLQVTGVGECGPGKVLSGLIKRIDRSLPAKPLNTVEQMQQFADSF
jgi:[acyl-carrier-protein] S-malonyltransferase